MKSIDSNPQSNPHREFWLNPYPQKTNEEPWHSSSVHIVNLPSSSFSCSVRSQSVSSRLSSLNKESVRGITISGAASAPALSTITCSGYSVCDSILVTFSSSEYPEWVQILVFLTEELLTRSGSWWSFPLGKVDSEIGPVQRFQIKKVA